MTQSFVSSLTLQLEQEKAQLETMQSQIFSLQKTTVSNLETYVTSVQAITQKFTEMLEQIGGQAEDLSDTVIIPMRETTRKIDDWHSTVLQLTDEVEEALSTAMWRITEVSTGLDTLTDSREKIQQIEQQLNQQLSDLAVSHQAALEQNTAQIENYHRITLEALQQKQQQFPKDLTEHHQAIQGEFDRQLKMMLMDVKARYTAITVAVLLLIMICLLIYVSKETYSKNSQLAYLDSQVLQRQQDLQKYDYAIQQRQMQLMKERN